MQSPSHTFPSWGKGGPAELLTSCPSSSTDNTGPLRVDREQTYQFLSTLFTEVAAAFPDETFHGGGDEVSFGCWSPNPEVKAWMKAHEMGANFTLLNNHYMSRLLQIITGANKTAMFWRPVSALRPCCPSLLGQRLQTAEDTFSPAAFSCCDLNSDTLTFH